MNTINTDDDYKRHPVTVRRQTPQKRLATVSVDSLKDDWDNTIVIAKRTASQNRNNAWKAIKRLYVTRGRA